MAPLHLVPRAPRQAVGGPAPWHHHGQITNDEHCRLEHVFTGVLIRDVCWVLLSLVCHSLLFSDNVCLLDSHTGFLSVMHEYLSVIIVIIVAAEKKKKITGHTTGPDDH